MSALKLYEFMGFQKKDYFTALKFVPLDLGLNNLIYRETQDFNLDRFNSFVDFHPLLDANDRLNSNWKYEKLIETIRGKI